MYKSVRLDDFIKVLRFRQKNWNLYAIRLQMRNNIDNERNFNFSNNLLFFFYIHDNPYKIISANNQGFINLRSSRSKICFYLEKKTLYLFFVVTSAIVLKI